MDYDFITQMYASITLDEEAPPTLNISEDLVILEESRLGRCIICKVLTNKPANKEVFRTDVFYVESLEVPLHCLLGGKSFYL